LLSTKFIDGADVSDSGSILCEPLLKVEAEHVDSGAESLEFLFHDELSRYYVDRNMCLTDQCPCFAWFQHTQVSVK
jgi:hypothetical protein